MIDVCVLSHNLPHLLCDFVDSLVSHEPAGSVRLLWWDNASEVEAYRTMLQHVQTSPIALGDHGRATRNLGFTPAMNELLRRSTAEYVCIANNDVVLLNPCLSIMRGALDRDPRLAAVGPVAVGGGWQAWERCAGAFGNQLPDRLAALPSDGARAAYLAEHHRDDLWRTPHPGMVAFFLTLIRREVLLDVGLLDARFGMGFGEDDQWCERAQRKGYEIGLCGGALAVHLHRATWRAAFGEGGIAALQHAASNQLEAWREEQGE